MKLCDFAVGDQKPFFLIAGPCVIESEAITLQCAEYLKRITDDLNINFIFKSSFDKANRTSIDSFRGLGIEEGLRILQKIKNEFNVPVITDVHENTSIDEVADVVDVLQTPAFLARQTDFITRVAKAGLPVNIKKAQFMAPLDMVHVVNKAKNTGNNQIMVCERGTMFGYNALVSDMRSLVEMRVTECPIIFDATHSVQMPGGNGSCSDGQRDHVETLARAAVAVGIDGLFIETHPTPHEALCDGPNMLPLFAIEAMLKQLQKIDRIVKV